MAKLRIHPAAKVLPEMGDEEFAELVADIEQNSLICPIALLDDQIIDGRHRYRACIEAGVEPVFDDIDLEGMPPGEYVWALNGNRRHLTPSQRAACYVELVGDAEVDKAISRQKSGKTLPQNCGKGQASEHIARAAGVSPRTVDDAKAVKKADPELFDKVKSGEVTASAAAKQLRGEKPQPERPSKPKGGPALKGGDGPLIDAWRACQNRLAVLKQIVDTLAPMEVAVLRGWLDVTDDV